MWASCSDRKNAVVIERTAPTADLMSLSSDARQFISHEATHMIMEDDPAMVAEGVFCVVNRARLLAGVPIAECC